MARAESPADQASFFVQDDWAVQARWQPKIGAPTMVVGIFDAEHVEVEVDTESGVAIESVNPVFNMTTASMPEVQESDGLRIEEVDYVVREIRPDGTGVSMLRLERL